MTIHDAKVEVTCDGCDASLWVELPFVYADISGKSGRYDHDDRKINKKVAEEGWTINEDGDHHFCENCSEDLS